MKSRKYFRLLSVSTRCVVNEIIKYNCMTGHSFDLSTYLLKFSIFRSTLSLQTQTIFDTKMKVNNSLKDGLSLELIAVFCFRFRLTLICILRMLIAQKFCYGNFNASVNSKCALPPPPGNLPFFSYGWQIPGGGGT